MQQQPQTQQSLQCGAATFNKLSFDPPARSSLLPTGRLVYVPLEQIVGGDICRLVSTARPHTGYSFTSYQQIITICGNCTECPTGLSSVYGYLQRMLKDVKISLIVIVRGVNLRQVNSIESDKKIRFAFIEEETPIALDDCQIVDGAESDALRSFSKTSVLFVSISFIILMVISLAWLVFYYVQRFRYAHAKDRLQRRLFNAAKKALTRIPTRPIRIGDKELDADCPVCIDPYRAGDIVRSLPCRHIFHKTCVDPWLLEHRTCPMCKSDILKAFGYHVAVGRRMTSTAHVENQAPRDGDRLSVDVHSSTGSESVFPYTGQSEARDPFSFTPTTSPQLVQVMHCANASAFSIIPLTVHSAQSPIRSANDTRSASANAGEASNLPRKISWQTRRPAATTHVINLVHVRSRSLSSESQRPKATFRSNTFGPEFAPLQTSPSRKRVEPISNESPITFAPDVPNSVSFSMPSASNTRSKLSLKRVSLSNSRRRRQRADLSDLASVESL
ncbi:unnamed protein product [Gongylonema pulchrum]|uniref:RING-type domain-containing protein n=1 Tax=Gongylonema pulchrum TaxID=637853 RepID=A0A183CXI9_9BILA|nr:unnamed protein product [Gongylonema pulchrum]